MKLIWTLCFAVALSACRGPAPKQDSEVEMFGMRTRAAEDKTRELASHIKQAATDISGVASADLIAAVLFDEMQHRDITDDKQDEVARKALGDSANRDRIIGGVPRRDGQTLGSVSFGLAQQTPDTIQSMHDSGFLWRRFDGYRGGFWDNLRMATTDHWTPYLVAYRLRQIREHWLKNSPAQGCRIDLATHADGAAILATLYSIGLTGERGVHCAPSANDRGRRIVDNRQAMRALIGN